MVNLEKQMEYAEKVAYFADKHGLDGDGWCMSCQNAIELRAVNLSHARKSKRNRHE